MMFKAFSAKTDDIDRLNRDVQEFIDKAEARRLYITKKTVHVKNTSDNPLIKPIIVITVWME